MWVQVVITIGLCVPPVPVVSLISAALMTVCTIQTFFCLSVSELFVVGQLGAP